MTTLLRASVLIHLLSISAMAAQIPLPTTLDALLAPGDFAVVGELTFDNFTYPPDALVQGEMPLASQINVEPLAGNDGLRFTGPFIDLPGGPGNGGSDAVLGFDVTATAPIASTTLSGNPSLTGVAAGVAEVIETFAGLADTRLAIWDKPPGGGLNLISSTNFAAPATEMTVLKDILLLSRDAVNSATISVIDQQFTLVPEPTGSSLIGMAALGILAIRKRR